MKADLSNLKSIPSSLTTQNRVLPTKHAQKSSHKFMANKSVIASKPQNIYTNIDTETNTPLKFDKTIKGQPIVETLVTEENLVMDNPQADPEMKLEYNPMPRDGASLLDHEQPVSR